ncbi:MAG TPA: T9SS type A sorting domain-containing protein, partial [Chitinophagales bacterium]|nr:T9SS type A sorting domain-containing protein [Chitinophagales bacterium]
LLAAPQPNLTRYFWNINGQTTEVKTPGSYTFTNHSQTPDTIPVTLTTVFYNYEVKNVHIANVTGGYCGDVEEVQCSCVGSVTSPDPYIKLPLLGYQSSYVSNTCTNVNFNGINQLIPLGLDTLVMQIWDADNGPPFGSQDDLIGNYTLHVSLNQYNYADNNADGFVTFDTVAGTSITETLNVIVNPTPPMPVVVATQDTFCNGDSVLLSLDTSATYNGYAFNWYRDTVYLTDVTDSAFYTSVPGAYKVIVNNLSTGCMNESGFDTITRVQSPQSPVQVVNAGSQLYVTPFAAGLAVAWYYNGALVPGQSGSVISYLGDGTYQAVVYTRVFPGCSTESAIDTVVTSGISDLTQDYGLSVIPNPNNGKFQVLFNATQSSNFNIYIRNLVGQTVFSKSLGDFAGKFMTNVDLGSFAKGVYVVTVESEKGSQNVKLIVQ